MSGSRCRPRGPLTPPRDSRRPMYLASSGRGACCLQLRCVYIYPRNRPERLCSTGCCGARYTLRASANFVTDGNPHYRRCWHRGDRGVMDGSVPRSRPASSRFRPSTKGREETRRASPGHLAHSQDSWTFLKRIPVQLPVRWY